MEEVKSYSIKNMTTDEKAKAYDEALKRAEKLKCENSWVTTIFPELAEDEDERIRKRAVAILKQQRDFWSYDGPSEKFPPSTPRKDLVEAIDIALSYLEKQKEQKPVEDKAFAEWVEDYWSHNKVNNPYSYNKGDEIQFDHKGFVSFCETYCYPQNLLLHDTFGYEEGRQTGQNEGVKLVLNNPEKYGLQKEQKPVQNPKKGCPTYPLSVVGDLLAKTPQEPIRFKQEQKPAKCTPDSALQKIKRTMTDCKTLSEHYKDREENFHQYYGGKAEGLQLALVYFENENELAEQKPAEWDFPYGVNETVDKLIAIAECLEMDGDCLFNGYSGTECGKFLRDLARKEVECKPVEWSEEDKNKLYQVVEILLADKAIALRKNPRCKALHKAYDELIDWLNSLPMNFPKSSDSWKPSEEQMDALKEAVYQLDGSEYSNGIDSLYNDLKKL